jgi:hypothetical protein
MRKDSVDDDFSRVNGTMNHHRRENERRDHFEYEGFGGDDARNNDELPDKEVPRKARVIGMLIDELIGAMDFIDDIRGGDNCG